MLSISLRCELQYVGPFLGSSLHDCQLADPDDEWWHSTTSTRAEQSSIEHSLLLPAQRSE